MAVPQKPNLRASGTGNLAYACRGLRQHSQEWLCHKDLKEKGDKPNPPLRFERAGGAQDSVLIQQGAPVDWKAGFA